MPKGGVEDTAVALSTRPSHRERRPLIIDPLHGVGIQRQDDMQVRREILARVPFFHELKAVIELLAAGKLVVCHDSFGRLLWAVTDELPSKHRNVWIHL